MRLCTHTQAHPPTHTHIHTHTITQCIDNARDILDTELTALVGESYSRAYGVMVNIQLLSELEEIIHCLQDPDRKQQLQKIWWSRLLVREGKNV